MKIRFIILLVFVASFLACADVGPKPSADFYVTFGGQPIDGNFSAVMLSCRGVGSGRLPENLITELNLSEYDAARNCSWAPERFAWGGDCTESRCSFSYMVPEVFRLAVYLPAQGKAYVSDPVHRNNFYSCFQADLSADGGMNVREVGDEVVDFAIFLIALTLTLFLELLTAVVFIFLTKSRWMTLIYVFAVNLISLPVVWFLFPHLPLPSAASLFLAEAFAVCFEAAGIYLLSRQALSMKRSLLLSVVMNSVSFFLGGFLLMLAVFK